jgi:hypothetical protein
MESVLDDRFVVFIRRDPHSTNRPDWAERPLISCSTYEEARRIQRLLHDSARQSVIRYVGPAGGGD